MTLFSFGEAVFEDPFRTDVSPSGRDRAGPQAEVVARHDARVRARYSPETVATAVRDVLVEVAGP